MAELVLPNDANPLGALLGGRLMHWIDLAGAMAAHRHSRSYVVTASVDHIDFLVPVRVGSLVILRSSVNRVFRTSMEVGVKVWAEDYIEDTRRHVASAHLTFVAVDEPEIVCQWLRSFPKPTRRSAASKTPGAGVSFVAPSRNAGETSYLARCDRGHSRSSGRARHN